MPQSIEMGAIARRAKMLSSNLIMGRVNASAMSISPGFKLVAMLPKKCLIYSNPNRKY
jgi:hypothetical protein